MDWVLPIYASGTGIVERCEYTNLVYSDEDYFRRSFDSFYNVSIVEYLSLGRVSKLDTPFECLSSNLVLNVSSLEIYSDTGGTTVATSLKGIERWCANSSEVTINKLKKLEDFSAICLLTNVLTLTINNTTLKDLSCLKNLTNLTTLALNDNSIANITLLSGLTKLTILDLRNNAIYNTYSETNDNIQTLIDLYNNGSLRTLKLSGNGGLDTESDKYKELIGLSWSSSSEF